MDTVVESRRRRGRYYLAVVGGLVGGIALAVLIGWMGRTMGWPAQRSLTVIGIVSLAEIFGVVIWAITHFLRCPQCGASDIMLAYPRVHTRRCPKCSAELA